MSKRVLSLFFVLMLLVGGAAACSDDSGDDGGGGGSSEDSGDGGGGGGNSDIAAYCDSVQEYVDAGEALAADPTDTEAQQTFQDLGTQLAEDAQALTDDVANLSPEEAQQFQDCQTDFAGAAG